MNRDKLKSIMLQHGLDRYDVADMVMVRKSTVDCWLAHDGSKSLRKMPDNVMELLELKLKYGESN